MPTGVSVALPVYRDAERLPHAARCITSQSLRDLDIIIILNGSDAPTKAAAASLARSDSRIRILDLPEPNLAIALNAALESARCDLVARMDADDSCPPERLRLQAEFMGANPKIAALGCAWELIDSRAQVISTVRPPQAPADLRWRLLLGNILAHGSMMLRRSAILKAGGYDPRCTRAQDFELWLRLSRTADLAALPQILYQHRVRDAGDPTRSTGAQAAIAAPLLLDAWRNLPSSGAGSESADLTGAMTAILSHNAPTGAPIAAIERHLSSGTLTREALMAWLWAHWFSPPGPRRAVQSAKRARLREVGAALRAQEVRRLYLWGAGDHTRWLLGHSADLGIPIAGLIDDHLAGEHRFGHHILAPASLTPGDTALISTDWHEDAIWQSSAPHRARGVRVIRLYEEP
jgi:Glycosyl transferase family 2